MANDRIWMRCTTCDERVLVTKHYPMCDLGELWVFSDFREFMSNHLEHHPNGKKMHLDGNPGLVFETDGDASGKLTEEILDVIAFGG